MVNDEKARKPLHIAAEAAGTPAAGQDARLDEQRGCLSNEKKELIQLIESLSPKQVKQVLALAEKLLPPR